VEGGETTSAESPSPPAPARRRRRWAALIGAGWVLLLLAVMVRTGGDVQADRTEAVPLGLTTVSPLGAGDAVTQQFPAAADDLSTVDVRFGTYQQTPTCDVHATLRDDRGAVVAEGTRACSTIPDATLTSILTFAPQAESRDRSYDLTIEVLGGEQPVTLFATPPRDDAPAATPTTLNPGGAAVEVHTGYGRDGRAYQQIPTLLDRIADYGPFWHLPVFVVGMVLGAIALTVGLALAPWRVALILLVAFAVVKGVLWSVVLPPMLGVDEMAHTAYAQFMAVEHAIPKRDSPANDFGPYSVELETATEIFHQPFVARSDRAGYGSSTNGEALADVVDQRQSNGAGAASGYAPTYYAVPAVLEDLSPGTIDVRLGVMRLWSVVLGAVTVLAAALAGRRLFPGRDSCAVLLGVAVALQPMLSQQTAVVNNDALVIAGGALCLLAALALVEPGRSRWWPLAAGAAVGLTLLGKPLGWAFVPVIGIAWLIGRLRGPQEGGWLRDAASGAAGFLVTYGAWWAFSVVFGYAGVGFMETRPGDHRGVRDFLHILRRDGFATPRANWINQYWGNFAWINIPFPPIVQSALLVGVLLGVVLGVWWVVLAAVDLWRSWRADGPGLRAPEWMPSVQTLICLLVVLGTLGLLHVLMFDYFHRTGDLDFIQGRYALMMTPALLALPALFLRRIWPRLSPIVPLGAVAVAMAVLNVIGLSLIAERFYL